jgi:hypothetical protein
MHIYELDTCIAIGSDRDERCSRPGLGLIGFVGKKELEKSTCCWVPSPCLGVEPSTNRSFRAVSSTHTDARTNRWIKELYQHSNIYILDYVLSTCSPLGIKCSMSLVVRQYHHLLGNENAWRFASWSDCTKLADRTADLTSCKTRKIQQV